MLRGASDNGSPAAPAQSARGARLRDLYETMVLIRVFEEETDRQYKRDRIGGYCHLCLGRRERLSGFVRLWSPTTTC